MKRRNNHIYHRVGWLNIKDDEEENQGKGENERKGQMKSALTKVQSADKRSFDCINPTQSLLCHSANRDQEHNVNFEIELFCMIILTSSQIYRCLI